MVFQIDIPHGSPFTLHNIPFGVISTTDNPRPRCATAIGEYAIDLEEYSAEGNLDNVSRGIAITEIFSSSSLNKFASLPRSFRKEVRQQIRSDISQHKIDSNCLIPLVNVTMHTPMEIGGFSDFYCSLEHCQNCAVMSSSPSIPKNWYYAPCVYNSRASSIIPSPRSVRRPKGVYFESGDRPTYGPSREIDYELELGYFVSKSVEFGQTLDIAEADEHIFGFVLLNDWSARDFQIFEMKPLGPFHAKGFGTSISPWIITMDALEPFRCAPKTKQDPPPFKHLKWPLEDNGTIDIKLRITLIRNGTSYVMGTSNLKYLYWTPFQQLTHHASAMCGMNTGDLLGTGTISGNGVDEVGKKRELGCLYEATKAGTDFITLQDGTQMKYLKDNDEVVLEAWVGSEDGKNIILGFGECRGKLLSAME